MAIKISKHGASVNKCQELATLIARHTDRKGNGFHQTAIDELEFVRESSVTTSIHVVSEPVFGIVVQGKKEALLNKEIYRYGVAQYIVVSVELPLSGFITEATSDKPYLGFKLKLDPNRLYNTIAAQTQLSSQMTNKSVRGLFVSNADTSLIDCAIGLTRLLDTPRDIPFLAPIVIREIHYRLLMGKEKPSVKLPYQAVICSALPRRSHSSRLILPNRCASSS